MATSTQCRTVTLSDEPEENDAFSGPHQRIADALAGLIQPPEAKGISIGVEGSWGSGKSTVARLLTKRLEGDANIATVSFDAWAHEGDPLRRTFLEAIINELKDRGWTRTDWQETIDKLANRLEEVTTKDKLSIKPWGRVLAFTLLLIPIGGAFINAALREDITLHKWKFIILLAIGLVLSFAPFLILLAKIKDESNLLGLFFNKGPTEKTTITNKTANPTSIEFEEQFNKLLEEVLKDNQKRIVLILDNLDRVDAKDALSIWSTLQTFFQHKGTKRALWHERLWLLVLYDLSGLSQLWENSDKNGGKTAISFIDKSFQVRFEVPALVLSDWRKFLMDQLTKAFPDHSESDLHEVYRVLAINVARSGKLLTIRELKLFINQIGIVHKQWAAGNERESDAFSLALIAYYVLLRRGKADVVASVQVPEFPEREYRELLGDGIRESLAAIAFNVEVDVAQQLLFSDKIKNALTLGSAEELKKVASLLRRGFSEVFEQTAKEWASNETVKIADAAIALEDSGLLDSAFRPPSVRVVTKVFCDRAGAVESWAPLDHRRSAGLAVILKWKNELQGSAELKEAFVKRLFSAIAQGLKDYTTEFDNGISTKEWLEYLRLVIGGLELSTIQSALTTVVEKVAEQCHSAELDSHRQICLEILIELEVTEVGATVEKQLRDFADSKAIEKRLSSGKVDNDRAVAFMLYTSLRYSSDFKGLLTDGGEVDVGDLVNSSMVATFVDLMQRHQQVSLLFSSLKAWPPLEPLVISSLRLVLNTPEAKDLFTGSDAVERLEFVFRHLPKSPDEVAMLTKLIAELQTQWDLLSALKAGIFKPNNAALYLLALRSSSGKQQNFVSWCVDGLRSVSSDIWNYEFDMGGPLFSLVFELKSRGAKVHLGEKYHLFLTYVIASTHETEVRTFPGQNLVELVGPLGSASRTLSQRDLEARLRDLSAALPEWFFSTFGAELNAMVLNSDPGQSVELLEIIFKRTELVALEWLKELLEQNGPSLKSKHSSESRWVQFKNSVRQALMIRASDTSLYPLIKGIANLLSIKPPRNGAIAFAVYGEARICLLEPKSFKTRNLLDLTTTTVELTEPTWSPDGTKLAYTHISDPFHSDIFVFDSISGTNTSITNQGGSQPAWSPDGKSLAFVRQNKIDHEIHTIDLMTKEERKLTEDGGKKGHPSWSPDGSQLVFFRTDSTSMGTIFIINADGSDQKRIVKARGALNPTWSPDGKRIAFASWFDDKEQSGIYLANPEGSDVVTLVLDAQPLAPVWSPDGKKILFQSGLGKESVIYEIDVDTQEKRLLTNGIDPAWQPLIDDGPDETTTSPSGLPAESSAS